MKLGDLIYDSHFKEHGLVIEADGEIGWTTWCTILYEDGEIVEGVRDTEPTIEVINESR